MQFLNLLCGSDRVTSALWRRPPVMTTGIKQATPCLGQIGKLPFGGSSRCLILLSRKPTKTNTLWHWPIEIAYCVLHFQNSPRIPHFRVFVYNVTAFPGSFDIGQSKSRTVYFIFRIPQESRISAYLYITSQPFLGHLTLANRNRVLCTSFSEFPKNPAFPRISI